MKTIIIAICALISLGFASCDETTVNPISNPNNSKTQSSDIDLLTSSLWERKFTLEINTTSGLITENRINRLEFNKGLQQQTFFLYLYFASQDIFAISNDERWSLSKDTISLTTHSGSKVKSLLRILKLTQDTLRFERLNISNIFKEPFDDTVRIHTYYRVK